MKRRTLACLICSVLALGMLSLAGCGSNSASGNSDQDAISKDLTSQLDSFKSNGGQAIAEQMKANNVSLQTLGINDEDFAKNLMDGFSYSVGTITVDSKATSATAEVKITSKTFSTALVALSTNLQNTVTNLATEDLSTDEKINAFVGKQLTEAVKSADTETTTITLTYTKSGDKWTMDSLETQIYKALGLDTIDLKSIYSLLGVSNSSELASSVNQLLSSSK